MKSRCARQVLRGNDLVGSPVTLTVRKKTTEKLVEISATRGSIGAPHPFDFLLGESATALRPTGSLNFRCRTPPAQIQAIGELFLVASEIHSNLVHNQRVTPGDILRVEAQAKIVNSLNRTMLDAQKEHIAALEQALVSRGQASGLRAAEDKGTLENYQSRVRSLEAELHKVRATLVLKEKELAKGTFKLEKLEVAQSRVTNLEIEINNFNVQINNYRVEVSNYQAELQKCKAELAGKDELIHQGNRREIEEAESARRQKAALEKAEARVAKLEEDIAALKNTAQSHDDLRSELETLRRTGAAEREAAAAELARSEERIRAMRSSREKTGAELEHATNMLNMLKVRAAQDANESKVKLRDAEQRAIQLKHEMVQGDAELKELRDQVLLAQEALPVAVAAEKAAASRREEALRAEIERQQQRARAEADAATEARGKLEDADSGMTTLKMQLSRAEKGTAAADGRVRTLETRLQEMQDRLEKVWPPRRARRSSAAAQWVLAVAACEPAVGLWCDKLGGRAGWKRQKHGTD
jgi:chromosome segregation ATPase